MNSEEIRQALAEASALADAAQEDPGNHALADAASAAWDAYWDLLRLVL